MRFLLKISILISVFAGSFQQHARPSTTQPPERSPSNLEECGGYESENFRIYNGEIAQIHEHPWYALIEINFHGEKSRCGGSIINPLFVVSAAHCFEKFATKTINKNPSEVKVILGEYDTEKNPDCEEDDENSCYSIIEMEVERLIMHSDYKGSRGSFVNDIALLELKWSMNFDTGSSILKPICLPIDADKRNMNLVNNFMNVAGFGRTQNEALSKIKRKVDLQIISTEECQGYFTRTAFQLQKDSANIPITINGAAQICAKGPKNEDTCNGDSGGPFVLRDKYLMGIVSFGPEDCGLGQFPAVFTRVSTYVDWIIENMKERRH